jgi:peptidoglycan/xylan/chitin deacetylase (PgdA/CDA1 family)
VLAIGKKLLEGPLVLLYHRVSDEPHDPFRMNVSPTRFAEHLQVLRERAWPLHLETLVHGGRTSPGRRAVAVTFDDGYADNVRVAKPLLEQAQTPATVFVTTGQPGQEFWWDALVRIVYAPAALPDVLDLTSERLRIRARPGRNGMAARMRAHAARWRGAQPQPARRALLRQLHRVLRLQPPELRQAVLERLSDWSGEPLSAGMRHRAATASELVELAKSPCIRLGAHSVSHPVLAKLPAPVCRREIEQSRRDVAEIAGYDIGAFSYPFGQSGDYSSVAVAAVRAAGFDCACAAHDGVVTARTNRFRLPRLWVGDWDGDEFAQRLSL